MALALALAAACARSPDNGTSGAPAADSAATAPAVATAAQAISAADLLQHTKDLSADSMEGRAPGTPGEEKNSSAKCRRTI